jgi:uncharacterized protein YqgV (UPF0045/DUF77 family)
MTDKIINCAIQIVPIGESKQVAYEIIDQAIAVIQTSGVKHQVTPFETVLEGRYDEVVNVIDQAQKASLEAGNEVLVYTKLHISKREDITFEEKRLEAKR